ncbi:hypothetical protein GIB67_032030 [Kingdonia uniflora]|uniref:Uncharacterized protein n=1 Tax=Kingdonia uniflora TaxID=39325 RepID=A0A7J7MWE1_9MAGN|nr:hypothetical protein GIB67_032030 [Kingdonia uniflora]
MEVNGDDVFAEIDSESGKGEFNNERSGIGKSSNPIRNLCINFKIEILVFDGLIDTKKLDNLLDRLETYFSVYKYSNAQQICFATLKCASHEYTAAFHNQSLVLDIDVDEYEVCMKYTGGLTESIRRELKLFTVANIEDATVKAIAIEGKYLKSDKEDDKIKSGYKSSWKNWHKGEGSSSKEFHCNHDKPNLKLTLMFQQNLATDEESHEELFHISIQVKQSLVEAIVNPDSLTRKRVRCPYLWDRDAIHYRRARKYRLVMEGKEFHINACKEHVTASNLVMATLVKRLVNATDKLMLLVRPVQMGLGLYKMFAALPEEEKGVLHTTCFAPLLLIDPMVMMSTLVVEIFDRHLGGMKFQFGEMIIQMNPFILRRFPKKKNIYGLKEIENALKQAKLKRHHDEVLRLNLLKIILSFLLPDKGRNVWVKYVDLRNHIEAPVIGVVPVIEPPVVGAPIVGASVIGSSFIATEIRAVVVRWKKGDEKYNNYKKDVEENVKSEEEQPQVAKEEDSQPPTVLAYYNIKKDVHHANESTYLHASADQKTFVSLEEQTIEVAQTEVVISHREEDVSEASQVTYHFFAESEVDVTLKKRHALTEEEINERAFKMAYRMNQLHAHLDELLPRMLLESFIQRPISQDEKNQVDQVWSLRKDKLSPEDKKDNRSTYMSIGY